MAEESCDGCVLVGGRRKKIGGAKWHGVELQLRGPTASENASRQTDGHDLGGASMK